jgi:hypothetical protein
MVSQLTYDQAQGVKADLRAMTEGLSPEDVFNALCDTWDGEPGLYEAIHVPNPETGVTLRNPGPDGSRMAAKYQRNVAAAGTSYVEGVQSPARSFKQAAIAAAGKHTQRTMEALQEGRFAKAMANVDEQEAITNATSDGGAAYTAGAAKRQAKVLRVMTKLAPMLGAVSQAIQSMPQDNDAQRAQRLLKARELMLQLGKRYKGVG